MILSYERIGLLFFISKIDEARRWIVHERADVLTTRCRAILLHSVSRRPAAGPCYLKKKDVIEQGKSHYPWPSTATKSQLSSQYIYRPVIPFDEGLWEGLCTPLNPTNGRLNPSMSISPSQEDVSGIWTPDENPDVVAKTILLQCAPTSLMKAETIEAMAATLSESLRSYRDFCNVHILSGRQQDVRLHDDTDLHHQHLKYRLIVTRGKDGVKCPLFHYDHVPVRWIQTFVGPGTELVVDGVGVRWDTFASFERDHDEDDTLTIEERNALRVDIRIANLYCAQPGEAVLMIGNDFSGKGSFEPCSSFRIPPVVHKSPKVSPGQARVRFTQDIEVCC
jgi:hypothetical protein